MDEEQKRRLDLAARGYDLSARNPHRRDERRLEAPAVLTARLLERSREPMSIATPRAERKVAHPQSLVQRG
jgi:hypothetical protein